MSQPASAQPLYTLGQYEILETLGAGGMGVVYRARDLSLDRIVALKVLREDLQSERHIVARFQREAEACAALNHPRIVHIYGVGKAGNVPFMVMELIEGTPLSTWLRSNGPMPWEQALRTTRQIAEALTAAHEAQIIHRDIKPGNILLDKSGNACVTDFGIAKVLTAATKLTFDGARLGTPQYMSPERREDRAVTPASDFYSLGVVLFQMLTGKTPFDKTPQDGQAFEIRLPAPKRLQEVMPDAPPMVDRLVAWLLELNPRHRPQDGASLVAYIDCILAKDQGQDLVHPDEVSPLTPMEEDTPTIALPAQSKATKKSDQATSSSRLGLRKGLGLAALLLVACALAYGAYGWISGQRLSQGAHMAWTTSAESVFGNAALLESRAETAAISVLRVRGDGLASRTLFAASGGAFLELGVDGEYDTRQALVYLQGQDLVGYSVVPPTPRNARILDVVATTSADKALVLFASENGAWLYRAPESFITLTTLPVTAGVLSPQGDRIALAQRTVNGNERVILAPVAGPWDYSVLHESASKVTKLLFSPDGASLFVQEQNDRVQMIQEWPLSEGGASPRLRYQGAAVLTRGSIAHDGVHLALEAPAAGGNTSLLVVQESLGAAPIEVSGIASSPAWGAADGRLYFVAPDRAGRTQAWSIDLEDPEKRTPLTHFSSGLGKGFAVDRTGQWAFAGLPEAEAAIIALTSPSYSSTD